MKENTHNKKYIRKLLIILGWLLLWQLISMLVHNAVLLCGPLEVIETLYVNIGKTDFWLTILNSVSRIFGGFVFGAAVGIVLAAAAFRWSLVREILELPMQAMESVPVASFVVLLLIWVGADTVSLYIAMLLVLPATYAAVLNGLRNADKELLEMANLYRFSGLAKYRYIYKNAVLAQLDSSFRVTVGMSFKSGVAAEIIGLGRRTLGEKLYFSKIQLDTAGLFAWTLVILALSYAFEKLVLFLKDEYRKYNAPVKPNVPRPLPAECSEFLHIYNVSKNYDGSEGLAPISFDAKIGEIVLLQAASGGGKTTLLHILAGLTAKDDGDMNADCWQPVSITFQENRLIENLDAVSNICLAAPVSKKEAEEAVMNLIGAGASGKPVSALSGGMRRRVALLRSLLTPSRLLLLDEPFTGLDEENHKKAAELVRKMAADRLVIVATHDATDAVLLGGRTITLQEKQN